MRRGRSLRTVLLLVVIAPGLAAGQDAALSGTVTDTTGLVLPGVTVEAWAGLRRSAGQAGSSAGSSKERLSISIPSRPPSPA